MSTKKSVLYTLKKNRGSYVSGASLSKDLSLTRTAVWKQINQLKKDGYGIDASPGLGYKLTQVPDRLLPIEIQYNLKTKLFSKEIHYFKEVESTINIVKDLAIKGYPEGTLVVAETQAGGRGRMGRKWFSPYGGIWFSSLMYPKLQPQHATRITITACISLVQAIDEVTGLKSQVKWPNDVLINHKKVAGILIEVDSEPDRIIWLVLSMGINANIDLQEIPQPLRTQVTSLEEAKGEKVDRVFLLKTILKKLEKNYEKVNQGNFNKIFEEWKNLCVGIGKKVKVKTAEKTIEGRAIDFDTNGALVIKLKNGNNQVVQAGDVTIIN